MAMAYSLILSSLLSQLINTWPNRKLLDYRYLEQLWVEKGKPVGIGVAIWENV